MHLRLLIRVYYLIHTAWHFHQYYIAYYIDGTMAIIKEWLETECRDSVEMIASVIEECVRSVDGTQGRMYSEIHTTPADKAAPKKVE